jgi:hypothetical protein
MRYSSTKESIKGVRSKVSTALLPDGPLGDFAES